MKQILFSCIGTTDPVRGEHDGPMLHILRHYRPECAVLFLTPEIRELSAGDDRLEKSGRGSEKTGADISRTSVISTATS